MLERVPAASRCRAVALGQDEWALLPVPGDLPCSSDSYKCTWTFGSSLCKEVKFAT